MIRNVRLKTSVHGCLAFDSSAENEGQQQIHIPTLGCTNDDLSSRPIRKLSTNGIEQGMFFLFRTGCMVT